MTTWLLKNLQSDTNAYLCMFAIKLETIMKLLLSIGITPLILAQIAGASVAESPTFTVRESSRNTLLRINTTYNFPVDAANSVTFASVTAGTMGSSCYTDTPGTDSDMDPDIGGTPDSGAHASASDTFLYCNPVPGGGCVAGHASSVVNLGLAQNRLSSTISVTTSVFNSKLTTSEGCEICEYQGIGQVGASWVAAWAQGQSGSISGIQVTMAMRTEGESFTDFCNQLTGGPTGEPLGAAMSDEFTSLTAEYFDSTNSSLGSETYQGVVFTDIDEFGVENISISGALYNDPSVGGPFQQPCPFGTDCEQRNVTITLAPPPETAHVVYTGETLNTSEFEYLDVNRDGVINYFDRVDIALSFGVDVNDPAYLPWADLTRNGAIDSADGTILESLSCIADLNNDGLVDLSDVNIYTGWFSSTDPDEQAKADLDGNGTNNFSDISIFSSMAAVGCSIQ